MTGTRLSLSRALGEQCAADWSPHFDAEQTASVRGIVRTAFMDTVACVFAGQNEPATARVAQWAGWAQDGRVPPLPARAGHGGLTAPVAALINATAGHALDYDDVGLAGHPSVVLVPALLSIHETDGVHGFALAQAYAKGYAVWAELQGRMKVHLHGRGWHPTAVFGTVAVAAAVASARQQPAAQVTHAMGIAASFAAGLIANFGSMTKPLQVGRAARAGIEAAELAAAGMDASPDALDGPTGLLAALGGPGNADLGGPPGEGFTTSVLRLRPGIKKYPVCYAAHRIVDGVLDLAARHRLRPADVARVDATISATTAGVLRHHAPQSLAEARFSLEYVVATALVRGALGPSQVSDESLADATVQSLMRRVHTHTVDTRCTLEPSFAYEDRVTVTTAGGALLDSGPIRFARGHAQLPLTESDIRAKLFACAGPGQDALADGVLARIDAALAD